MPLLDLSEAIDHLAHAVFELAIPALIAWAIAVARLWVISWKDRFRGNQ